ncbi:MAG: SRPBCC family protein [Planctomycetota bacterium]|nr:SRPBCC family protein [Planctomycetota bacterium]
MSGIVKFLLFLVIAMGITIGCLWFLGGKKQEYSTVVSINASTDQVYPYLTEPERIKKWNSELVEIRLLQEGPIELGSKLVSSLQFNGTTQVFKEEVIRFQENEVFTVRSRASDVIFSSIFKLENESGKTRLSYQVKLTNRGLNRLMAPLQDSDLRQQQMVRNVLALKKIVESEILAMPFNVRENSPDRSGEGQTATDEASQEGERSDRLQPDNR